MAKSYKVLVLIAFQILMTLKFLLILRTYLITQANSLVLTSTPHTLNFKLKKLPLGVQLLQHLPNGTDVLQNLRNGKKLLQNYGMEQKTLGGVAPLHSQVNPSMVTKCCRTAILYYEFYLRAVSWGRADDDKSQRGLQPITIRGLLNRSKNHDRRCEKSQGQRHTINT